MLLVSGANLCGQWLSNELSHQKLCKVKLNIPEKNANVELTAATWSYNLWKSEQSFYLTGSWLGEENQIIKVNTPKNLELTPTSKLCLLGNDYKLILFSKESCDFWVLNLDIPFQWNWMHKTVPTFSKEPNVTEHASKRQKHNKYIVKAVSSNHVVICLVSDGEVYALPNKVDTSACQGKVEDIACGFEHAMLLTDTGQVYTWGNGKRCQLGHGDLHNIEEPTLVQALAGIKIKKIVAGGWHSFALCESGDLYAWGWNDTGQLGIKNSTSDSQKSLLIPTVVDFFDNKDAILDIDVIDMACGSRHSAVITSDNAVWTTGINNYGQLGVSAEEVPQQSYFKKIYQTFDNSILMCGPWSTIIKEE